MTPLHLAINTSGEPKAGAEPQTAPKGLIKRAKGTQFNTGDQQ